MIGINGARAVNSMQVALFSAFCGACTLPRMARRSATDFSLQVSQPGHPGADWMRRFIEEGIERFTAASARVYCATWRSFLEALARQQRDPASASSADIRRYLLQLQHPETRRRYGRLLCRVYEYATLHGWLALNPMPALAAEFTGALERPAAIAFHETDWRHLLERLPAWTSQKEQRDQTMVTLILGAGLRLEELRDLRLSQLTETPSGLAVHLAGGTVKARTLCLDPRVAERVRAWATLRRAACVPGVLVFPDSQGRSLAPNTVYRRIGRVLLRLEGVRLPPRLSAGVLRTTFARGLLQTESSVTAQQQLGHRRLGSTLRMSQSMKA
jgi:integrase